MSVRAKFGTTPPETDFTTSTKQAHLIMEAGCNFPDLALELRVMIYEAAVTGKEGKVDIGKKECKHLLAMTAVSKEARLYAVPSFWKNNAFYMPDEDGHEVKVSDFLRALTPKIVDMLTKVCLQPHAKFGKGPGMNGDLPAIELPAQRYMYSVTSRHSPLRRKLEIIEIEPKLSVHFPELPPRRLSDQDMLQTLTIQLTDVLDICKEHDLEQETFRWTCCMEAFEVIATFAASLMDRAADTHYTLTTTEEPADALPRSDMRPRDRKSRWDRMPGVNATNAPSSVRP